MSIRHGGRLADVDHRLPALLAATCAEHVLELFELPIPDDHRPHAAIEAVRAWTRGEAAMMATRAIGGHAMGAARPLRGASRFAAYAAGQAACVAHIPEHDLGVAAYAIKAVSAAVTQEVERDAARAERARQRQRIPVLLRSLVLEDQTRRSSICWSVFDD